MTDVKPYAAEVKARGQLTIPKKVREAGYLEEGQSVTLIYETMSRVLRVFLDSNVIVSGLFSDRGAPRLILDILALDLPVLKAVTGEYNVSKVDRTLKTSFRRRCRSFGPRSRPWPSRSSPCRIGGTSNRSRDCPRPRTSRCSPRPSGASENVAGFRRNGGRFASENMTVISRNKHGS